MLVPIDNNNAQLVRFSGVEETVPLPEIAACCLESFELSQLAGGGPRRSELKEEGSFESFVAEEELPMLVDTVRSASWKRRGLHAFSCAHKARRARANYCM